MRFTDGSSAIPFLTLNCYGIFFRSFRRGTKTVWITNCLLVFFIFEPLNRYKSNRPVVWSVSVCEQKNRSGKILEMKNREGLLCWTNLTVRVVLFWLHRKYSHTSFSAHKQEATIENENVLLVLNTELFSITSAMLFVCCVKEMFLIDLRIYHCSLFIYFIHLEFAFRSIVCLFLTLITGLGSKLCFVNVWSCCPSCVVPFFLFLFFLGGVMAEKSQMSKTCTCYGGGHDHHWAPHLPREQTLKYRWNMQIPHRKATQEV